MTPPEQRGSGIDRPMFQLEGEGCADMVRFSRHTITGGGQIRLRTRFGEFETEVSLDPEFLMNRIRRFICFPKQ